MDIWIICFFPKNNLNGPNVDTHCASGALVRRSIGFFAE